MHRRAKAWALWLSSAIALAIVATAATALIRERAARSPRTAASLHLPIDDLRSHAEEARLLARLARERELDATFTRQHARQLGKRVEAALRELQNPGTAGPAPAKPAPAPSRPAGLGAKPPGADPATAAQVAAAANDARRARRLGDNLARALQRLGDAPRPAAELDAVEPIFAASARELGYLATATQEAR
jgi:hypothetical protein